MSCPNNDPRFDSFLFGSGLIDPNAPDIAYQRRRVYYTICVLFRLFLAGLVYQLKDHDYIPFVIGLASVVAIFNLYPRLNNTRQWWSIKFQFLISVVLLVSSVLVYYKKIKSDIIPFTLYASVTGGVILSLFVKSC
jgi:uncharacterized membrane protein (UPF0136 family)